MDRGKKDLSLSSPPRRIYGSAAVSRTKGNRCVSKRCQRCIGDVGCRQSFPEAAECLDPGLCFRLLMPFPSFSFEFVLHACSQGQGALCVHLQETGIEVSQEMAMTLELSTTRSALIRVFFLYVLKSI